MDTLAFTPPPVKPTAAAVADAVRRHYRCATPGEGVDTNEWASLDEFTLTPGLSGGARIDLLMVRAWSSKPKGHERHAIEIKVNRGDLRNELAHPEKRAPFVAVCHRFYFATPEGLTDGIDLPPDVGHLVMTERGTIRQARSCARREPDPVTERTFVEAFRRADRAEARIRHAGQDDPAAELARLRRQITSLERSIETATAAVDREKERTRALLALFAAATAAPDIPCRCGGGVLMPRRGAARHAWRGGILYEHRNPERACSYPEPDWSLLADRLDRGDLTP